MKTITYKTNINCGGCVATVKPYLDAEASIQTWSVNTQSSDKILTVTGEQPNAESVQAAVKKAGFRIESPYVSK